MRIKNLKPGFERLTNAKARLIAHLIGDGCVYKCRTDYNIKYDNIDSELLNQFVKDFNDVYGYKITIAFKPSGKTGLPLPYLRFRSKLIYEDLKSYCEYASAVWFVPKQILNNSKNIQKEFLKALFDDEGSVIPYGKTAILRLYSINLKGLKEIQELLQNFNFDSVIVVGFGCKRNVYGLTIKDISNFHHKIGFYCIRKQKKLLKYVKEV
ncbi:MAG: hypothetical protein KJ597_04815 [Nanoarchaeota archaeon]|nr:hypothetical protein [Nanoarchaeota archaeon]MBU1622866.1 hypothetical protein [Nanoarchaeota archaeon]